MFHAADLIYFVLFIKMLIWNKSKFMLLCKSTQINN